MLTLNLGSVARCMAIFLLLRAGNNASAQSALSTIPQQAQTNGENRVVTKSNNVTNSAMNKVDSASNKAFKSFTGLFKKKNKKKAADSTAVHASDSTALHAPDSTALPKTSSFNPSRPTPALLARSGSSPALEQKSHYFKNTIIETYQS